MLKRCTLKEFELPAKVARRLWFRRNSVVHGGDILHSNALIIAASSYIEDYCTTMKLEEEEKAVEGDREGIVGPIHHVSVYWKPPSFGYYKVNWDASLNHAHGKLGIGIIVRDTNGNIFAASSSSILANVEPVVAESMAALHAIEFCCGRGLIKIILEGDSLQVVSAIKKQGFIWATHRQIIADIQDVLRFFQSWEVCHTKCAENSATHLLAKACFNHAQERVWIHCIPECISLFVPSEDSPLVIWSCFALVVSGHE